jgi:protease-4
MEYEGGTEMTATSPLPKTNEGRLKDSGSAKSRGRLAGALGDDRSFSGFRVLGSFLMWIVAPLLIGIWLAQTLVPQPAVGIIRLTGDIYVESADYVMLQVQEAREDPNIQAIVVELDSPGGEVAATQELYLELQNLRRQMPVVGSMESIAASGAYYAAMATDPIYAKPSSTVGNVGVWGYIPLELAENEVILASGPFKLTASNRDEFLRAIEEIKLEFLETVFSQRGERMNISRVDLSNGLAYSGREARRLGLIDYLGSESDAVAAAAQQAGIAHYQVVDLAERVYQELMEEYEGGSLEPWVGAADPETGERVLPPGVYLLYDTQLGGAP